VETNTNTRVSSTRDKHVGIASTLPFMGVVFDIAKETALVAGHNRCGESLLQPSREGDVLDQRCSGCSRQKATATASSVSSADDGGEEASTTGDGRKPTMCRVHGSRTQSNFSTLSKKQ
jgi:hypothetical protein